ncbi:MAG: DUF4292 domain-containing protein [Myxococcaceae bacterium]
MRRVLPALAISLFLLGCPPKRIEFGPTGPIDDPEAVLKLVAENEARVVTLVGESKVRVDTPQGRGSFSMFVALSRPGLIHFEPLDFFGRPVAVLVVNGDSFGLYQSQENRYYTGPASPANVSRFLPIALPADELTRIMLGVAPRIPHEQAELRIDGQECLCYVLTLRRGDVTQTLQVDPVRLRVKKSVLQGIAAYDLEFDDFKELDKDKATTFPQEVRLTADGSRIDLQVNYRDVTLNEAPDLMMFDLTPPEDVPVVEVDVSGRPKQEGVPPPHGPELQAE